MVNSNIIDVPETSIFGRFPGDGIWYVEKQNSEDLDMFNVNVTLFLPMMDVVDGINIMYIRPDILPSGKVPIFNENLTPNWGQSLYGISINIFKDANLREILKKDSNFKFKTKLFIAANWELAFMIAFEYLEKNAIRLSNSILQSQEKLRSHKIPKIDNCEKFNVNKIVIPYILNGKE